MGWNLALSGFGKLFANISVICPENSTWVMLPTPFYLLDPLWWFGFEPSCQKTTSGSLFRRISLVLFPPGIPKLLLCRPRLRVMVDCGQHRWETPALGLRWLRAGRIRREHQGSSQLVGAELTARGPGLLSVSSCAGRAFSQGNEGISPGEQLWNVSGAKGRRGLEFLWLLWHCLGTSHPVLLLGVSLDLGIPCSCDPFSS